MILLLGDSSFQLNDYLHRYNNTTHCKKSVSYLEADLSRLEELTQKLSEINNWVTTKEVVEKFADGTIFFKSELFKKGYPRQKINITKKHIKQRDKTLELLSNDYHEINSYSNKKLKDTISKNQKTVEEVYERIGKNPRNKEKNIELVNIGLAYATQEQVCVFSNNVSILKTFINLIKEFDSSEDYFNLSENSFILGNRYNTPTKATNTTF